MAASLAAGALGTVSLAAKGVEIPADVSQHAKPTTIKVLISKQQDKILLEAKGRYSVFNILNSLPVIDGGSTKRRWLSASESGLVWGELLPGVFQMRIVPKDGDGSLLVNGIEYKGCLEIYEVNGKIHIVNEVDIERYLKSTMAFQFQNEQMDDEVMDAVAITARTNAYYLVSRKPMAHWHVVGQDVDYQGYALTWQNPIIERAIDHTRHMVLTYEDMPFPTAWTKHSAGKTADFATIFRKDARAPQGVDAPFAAHEREKSAWTFSLTKQELAKALGAAKVTEFDLYLDNASQKVYGARLKEGSQTHQFDFAKLQQALGSSRLKSNDFTVQTSGERIVFKGFGEGSGVGLCLFSASAMADKGAKAAQMLAAFFPQSKLENIFSLEERDRALIQNAHAISDSP